VRHLVICLAFVTSACGICEPGDMGDAVTTPFETRYGFGVLPNGHRVVPAQIYETIVLVEQGLRKIGPSVFNEAEWDLSIRLIVHGDIVYVGDPFPCSDGDGTCLGEASRDIKIAHEGCIGETSLAHEFIHKFAMYAGGHGDYGDHANPDLFGGDNSLEGKIENYQRSRYCNCD